VLEFGVVELGMSRAHCLPLATTVIIRNQKRKKFLKRIVTENYSSLNKQKNCQITNCEITRKCPKDNTIFFPRGPSLYYVRVKRWVGGIDKYLLFLTGVGGWF